MKISKITIKQLFGIKEWQGDGKNIELVGDNGTGKTSVIDAIRYALTNSSDREFITCAATLSSTLLTAPGL